MNIYRNEDIQAMTDKLEQIIDESLEIRSTTMEPTIDEYRQAIDVIKGFLKKKKRIIYGGNAWNTLICNINPKDAFYKPLDQKDIEFYTPEPVQDLVDLCNLLHDRKFKWVQGKSAQHEETYKLYMNFLNISDMSYMPRNIYQNMPIKSIDGLMYTHPSWIFVDIFRQYNDPITSFWRLKDKTFFRANTLFKNYPLDLHTGSQFKKCTGHMKYKEKLFKKLQSMDSIIFTGSIPRSYYQTLKKDVDFSHMHLFSTNFREDAKTINGYLEEIMGKDYEKISVKMYRPFFQFWDERIEFCLDNECIIKVFGNYGICLPYNNLYINNNKIDKIQTGGHYKECKEGSCIKVATFMLLFNHILIARHYEYINRSENYKKYEHVLHELLKQRNKYLKDNKVTVMDNTPYREFIIKCTGRTIDPMRKAFLKMNKKRQDKKNTMFVYNPATQKETYKAPEVIFKNTSGNEYKNGVMKLLGSPINEDADLETELFPED